MTTNQKRNIQLTQKQLEYIQSISNSKLRSFLFKISSGRRRRRILGELADSAPSPKASVEIPKVWQTRIEDLTRESNRQLVEKWGVPLERYHYPL